MNENNFNDELERDSEAVPQGMTEDGFAKESEPLMPENPQNIQDGFSYTPEEYAPASEEKAEAPLQPAEPQMPAPAYNPYVANAASNQQQTYYYAQNPYQTPATQPAASPEPASSLPPEKKGGKTLMWLLILICVVVAVSGMVVGIMGYSSENPSDDISESSTLSPDDSDVQDNQQGGNSSNGSDIQDNMNVAPSNPDDSVPNSVYVAEKVRPSVVGVMTYVDGKLYGEGSGVLMSEKDGWTYVVTCAHVISEKGVEYGILLLDGTTLSAELVAYDQRTDIGVVKVNKTGLPLAEFGDSTTLKIGEPIYAIGNPGGSEYFGSITDGIIAAIDRSVTSTYTMTCIQHNAAINPGNSGGALVNSSGQIIGINSSKIASTEFEGMGFAVPTSIAGPVVDALISYGYVPNRPKLGIEYAPVSSYQLYSLIVSIKGLPQGSLVIASIAEDSSLAGTDVQEGDLIIGVNGKDMDDSSVLLDLIETGAVGDSLTLTICRIDDRTYKTTEFDVTITLVEDKGSTSAEEEEEPTTQSRPNFFSDYFGW